MNTPTILFLCYTLFINLLTLLLYGIDKRKAQKKRWRIPEKTLLLTAFFGGSVGALIGMLGFRHKTKHAKFKICIPLFFLLHLILFAVFCA